MIEKKINCLTCEFGTLIGHTCRKNVPIKDRVKSGKYYVCSQHEHAKSDHAFLYRLKGIMRNIPVSDLAKYLDEIRRISWQQKKSDYFNIPAGGIVFQSIPTPPKNTHINREGKNLCGSSSMVYISMEQYTKDKNAYNLDAVMCPECLKHVYKSNNGKLSYDEIPFEWFALLARIFDYGKKSGYAKHSWKNVPAEDYYDAHMRHLKAHREGEFIDKDSGCPHIEHAIWNLNAYYAQSRKDGKNEPCKTIS